MGIFHNIIRYSKAPILVAIFPSSHLDTSALSPLSSRLEGAMVFFQGGCMHNSIAIETPETPNLNVSTCIHFKVMWSQRNDLKNVFMTLFFCETPLRYLFDVFFVLWKSIKASPSVGVYPTRLDHGHSKLYNLVNETRVVSFTNDQVSCPSLK